MTGYAPPMNSRLRKRLGTAVTVIAMLVFLAILVAGGFPPMLG
jgi:hypothetical protein